MNAFVFEQPYINGTLLQRKRSAVTPGMVLECMHVLFEQLVRRVVSEQLYCGGITEETRPGWIASEDSFRSRVENETRSLFAQLKSFFRSFSFAYVFR